MPAESIPDRIVWAVEMLDIQASDQVLEIGCGHGLAASLVCDKLGRGKLTAMDRSTMMIEAARTRNGAQIAAGKVQFQTASLADADFGRQRFSKIFAINVNLFWIDPTKELPVVKRLLRPEGALYLFYQQPSPAQSKPPANKVSRNLEAGSFVVDGAITGKGLPVASLCVIARATSEGA